MEIMNMSVLRALATILSKATNDDLSYIKGKIDREILDRMNREYERDAPIPSSQEEDSTFVPAYEGEVYDPEISASCSSDLTEDAPAEPNLNTESVYELYSDERKDHYDYKDISSSLGTL